MRVLTTLVDLVDGDGHDTESERGRTGKDHTTAVEHLFDEQFGDHGPLPLAQRVARAPGSGEDIARISDSGHKPFLGERCGLGVTVAVYGHSRDGDWRTEALAEVRDGATGDLPRVLLEAERSVEKDRRHGRRAQLLEKLAMDLHHRGRGLSRAHDREQPRKGHGRAHWPSGCGVPSQRRPPGGSPQRSSGTRSSAPGIGSGKVPSRTSMSSVCRLPR